MGATRTAQRRREQGIDWQRWRELPGATARELWRDNALGTSAEIAFFLAFSIPPLLILLVMLAAIINQHTGIDVVGSLKHLIDTHAPADSQDLFNSLVSRALQRVGAGVASLGVVVVGLLGLWSTSNAVTALLRVANKAYGVKDTRSFLRRRLLALGLALLIILTINPAIILFFFGDYLGQLLAGYYHLGHAFVLFWAIARWPVAIAFLAILFAVLYYTLPNLDESMRWVSPGSIVATVVWILGAGGFRIYLHLSDPASIYGAFGGVMVLLAFLYMTGFAFLLGAKVNAILTREYDPEAARDLRRNPEKASEPKEMPSEAQHA